MPASARMSSTISERRPASRRIEQPAALLQESPPNRGRRGRLLSTLARIARIGADLDEATFIRLEYRGQNFTGSYTTARDEQLRTELLGPPPLGL